MRRLLLLASAVVFVDTMFIAAITPLLPYLQDRIGLSKAAAGLLVASYPAGTLVGAIPGAWMASRLGVKPVVLLGLALMAVSTFVFGFARTEVMLDLARVVQGLGGAFSWVGMMSWLVSEAPRDRRGEMIGTALGAAIVGALFGPVVGSLAIAVGLEIVFSAVVVLAAGLATWAVLTPAAPADDIAIIPGLRAARRSLRVRGALWLVLLPSLIAGVFEVLMPLRLDQLGAAKLLSVGCSWSRPASRPWRARSSAGSRTGGGACVPIRFGLAVEPVIILALAVPRSPAVLAVRHRRRLGLAGDVLVPGDGSPLRCGGGRRRRTGHRLGALDDRVGGRSGRGLGRRQRASPRRPPTSCPTRSWRRSV